jgi:hypothetical protein
MSDIVTFDGREASDAAGDVKLWERGEIRRSDI